VVPPSADPGTDTGAARFRQYAQDAEQHGRAVHVSDSRPTRQEPEDASEWRRNAETMGMRGGGLSASLSLSLGLLCRSIRQEVEENEEHAVANLHYATEESEVSSSMPSFDAIDRNDDGVIDRDEWARAMDQLPVDATAEEPSSRAEGDTTASRSFDRAFLERTPEQHSEQGGPRERHFEQRSSRDEHPPDSFREGSSERRPRQHSSSRPHRRFESSSQGYPDSAQGSPQNQQHELQTGAPATGGDTPTRPSKTGRAYAPHYAGTGKDALELAAEAYARSVSPRESPLLQLRETQMAYTPGGCSWVADDSVLRGEDHGDYSTPTDAFDTIDRNGDGLIDRTEWAQSRPPSPMEIAAEAYTRRHSPDESGAATPRSAEKEVEGGAALSALRLALEARDGDSIVDDLGRTHGRVTLHSLDHLITLRGTPGLHTGRSGMSASHSATHMRRQPTVVLDQMFDGRNDVSMSGGDRECDGIPDISQSSPVSPARRRSPLRRSSVVLSVDD